MEIYGRGFADGIPPFLFSKPQIPPWSEPSPGHSERGTEPEFWENRRHLL